jgi:hypothetical protein
MSGESLLTEASVAVAVDEDEDVVDGNDASGLCSSAREGGAKEVDDD